MLEVELIVKGQIAEQWSEWFDNLTVTYPQQEQTVLSGLVEDQAALHGLISRLWDLGLPLISVRTGPQKPPEPKLHVNVRAIIERETPQGREIILQTRSKPHEGGKWLELPGGRVEPFESLVTALRREVREETGLKLTHIVGLRGSVQSSTNGARVECLAPFAAYQTLRGPVDSLGFYFRCQAAGDLLPRGDDTENIRWVPVAQVSEWLQQELHREGQDPAGGDSLFSWVDRAGLLFYLSVLKQST